MASSNPTCLTNLPTEILLVLREYLDELSLSRLVKVSRRFYGILNPMLWKSAEEGISRATFLNNVDAVRKFIEIGADLDLLSETSGAIAGMKLAFTALHLATFLGYAKVVAALLDAGAARDVSHSGSVGVLHSPLVIAMSRGHSEIVDIFLHHYSDADEIIDAVVCFAGPGNLPRGVRKRALSIMLARQRHEESKRPDDLDALDAVMNSALDDNDIGDVRVMMEAFDISSFLNTRWFGSAIIKTGSIDLMGLLIKSGEDVNRRDFSTVTPLIYSALEIGDLEMVRYLHEQGAYLNYPPGTPPLRPCPAYGAVASQKPEVLEFALDLGAKIPCGIENHDIDVLHYAIMPVLGRGMALCRGESSPPRSIPLLKRLIELGADVNGKRSDSRTPLNATISQDWPEATRLLLEHGAAVNTEYNQFGSPLHNATREDLLDTMEILLQHGADPNLLEMGRTERPLYLTASAEAVSLLIKYGASPDGGDNRRTPLQLAVTSGRVGAVSALLEGGASPTAVTAACQTEPILMAVGSCWLPTCYPACDSTCDTHVMVKLLLQHGAPIDTRMPGSGMQPLTQAIRSTKHGCVKVLVENGADIHHETHGGMNAIHYGCIKRSIPIVRTLLEHGGDPSRQTEDGSTALHYAVSLNCSDLVALMLEHDMPIDKPMRGGKTALHLAVVRRRERIVSMLLEHGANANAERDNGVTILHTAATQDNWRIVSKLLDSKAAVDIKDRRGKTPLIAASSLGRNLIVETMLQHGARLDITDNTGRTALDWAIVRGHDQTAQILRNGGATVTVPPEDSK